VPAKTPMILSRSTSLIVATLGVVLMVGVHGLVGWGGITLGGKIGGSLPWIAGGAFAFGLYHVLQAFGLYHVVQHFRSRSHGHLRASHGDSPARWDVERGLRGGPLLNLGHGFVEVTICETAASARFRLFFYDKHKQPRALPRNASVTIDTVRPTNTQQTFELCAKGEYLESTSDVPEPHGFKAIVHISHGSHTHTHEIDWSD
jgi:phosphotransferase system  glucose/maltose/N-acetylglucosamine-specific IIC component